MQKCRTLRHTQKALVPCSLHRGIVEARDKAGIPQVTQWRSDLNTLKPLLGTLSECAHSTLSVRFLTITVKDGVDPSV